MSKTIDARGLECPEPAIQTGNAIRDHDEITVIVDDEASVQNITSAVERRGFEVTVDQQGKDYYLTVVRKPEARVEGDDVGSLAMRGGDTVIFIPSDRIGQGDEELGRILSKAIIYSLTQVEPKPDTLILMNGGVKFAVEGSEVLDDLKTLVKGGMTLLVCGTCLDFFGIKEKLAVGGVSNAYTIAETMLEAGKVIRW